ncbi:MAG: hypothetical protein H6953_00745 [Chromatiaceae bacterium]|nr:hypothetical protein [Chromatiaceae bacterium]MCP5313672.1 hypothetical protein [Chromatiaceae bacterium]
MRLGILPFAIATAFAAGVATTAFADDGAQVLKSMSKASGNPVFEHIPEAEHAFIDMMKFYVPLQAANGTVGEVDYLNADAQSEGTRLYGKPLVAVYINGPVEGVEGVGFVGHGKREAYGAVSLDDGVTWKSTNLSESADDSSSDVVRSDIELFADSGGFYPGDVVNVFQATSGTYTLAVWPSRFCAGGEPNYSLDVSNIERRESIATALGIDLDTASFDDLYLVDMYGVGGTQGSVDYSEDEFEQNQPVGEVPFSCLWAARGVLVNGDDPRTEALEENYMRWFKAERLTSGARDVNRIETFCAAGAGCAITWQEDPEGLRPGQGEGPGEGWSGAIANSQTDVWYSYIPWDQFAKVQDPEDNGVTIHSFEDWLASGDTTKPQPGIPFAMPMRITDNARCNVTNPKPYCNGAAVANDELLNPLDYGLKDMCANTVQIPTGPQGTPADICVTEDGLPLVGNIAATRPRLSLKEYDVDEDGIVDGAFAVIVAEESKGLGAFGFIDNGDGTYGESCDPDGDVENCVVFDEGKNMWYYSFDMLLKSTFAGSTPKSNPDSLVANLVGHGNMLNQPEVDWRTGEFSPAHSTAELWDFGEYNYELWNTEIARRGSLLVQGIGKAADSTSGLLALPAWKQGVMNQGGPADVMVRRILLAGYGGGTGETCPVVVDGDQPVITTAVFDATTNLLSIAGTGADGWNKSLVVFRDASSQENLYNGRRLLSARDDVSGAFSASGDQVDPIPCAIQAADADGSLEYGPFTLVTDTAGVPLAEQEGACANPLPDVCLDGSGDAEGPGWDGLSNPYAFRNIDCDNMLYGRNADGTPINPFYPDGLCMDPAINLSAVVPDVCTDSQTGETVSCPAVDLTQGTTFGVGDTNPVLQGNTVEPNQTKVLSWHQCPYSATVVAADDTNLVFDCSNDARTDDSTLADQSWYNPLDVAKGHRGFLNGDFVMMLYAWSPNWRLNAKGSDRYELYIRRSFDGAQTFTTTPSGFEGDGTVTCETFRSAETGTGEPSEPRVCNEYAAGADEQARNVTQHKSMRITTLDPRYSEPVATITADPFEYGIPVYETADGTDENESDPSRYFVVFETGDNTTTAEGEPEPLDLYYGRAINWGDDYVVWADEYLDPTLSQCFPSDPHEEDVAETLVGTGFCNEFDKTEQGTPGLEASEASLEANPGGEFLYAVWTQAELDEAGELVDSDAMARRVWWIDNYLPADAWDFGQGDGSGTPAN